MKIALRSLSLFPGKGRGQMSEHGKAVIVLSVLALTASLAPFFKLEAQSDYKIGADQRVSLGGYDNTAIQISTQVTVSVKDSSLMWVIEEISRQARLKPVFNGGVQALSKKVSIDINNTEALTAIKRLLRNTGLVARLASDGETLMVRQMSESGKDTLEGKGAITGRVLDSATGKGVEGVTVAVQGSSLSAITDGDGRFVLRAVPVGQRVLTFRLLGYTSRFETVAVKAAETKLEVKISSTATALNEVVTTATGPQRRLEVANDIARINVEELIKRAPIRNVTDLLKNAQIPGVSISPSSGAPGAPARIRIRGIGSISRNNDPVVVVDGVWVNSTISSGQSGYLPSPLDNIDPSTIETIEIVKGPSAATLYGPEAANGVIVITTKKGMQGATRWGFSYDRDWSSISVRKAPVWRGFGSFVLSDEYGECDLLMIARKLCLQDSVVNIGRDDWLLTDETSSLDSRYSFGMDGGAQSLTFSLNGAIQDQISPVQLPFVNAARLRKLSISLPRKYSRPEGLESVRLSGSLNLEPVSGMDMTFSISGNQDRKFRNLMDFERYRFIDPRDTVAFAASDGQGRFSENTTRRSSVLFNAQATWRPNYRWTSSIQGGVQRQVDKTEGFTYRHLCSSASCVLGEGEINNRSRDNSILSTNLRLSYTPSFGRIERYLTVQPSFGLDIRKSTSDDIALRIQGIPPGTLDGGHIYSGDARKDMNATAGWWINGKVGVWNRVYFDFGVRHDIGSAILGSGVYPKFGTSWLVSDEPFFPDNPYVSLLRFRIALGHAAVQPDRGDIKGRYMHKMDTLNGQLVQTYVFQGPGNNRLVPERAIEIEGGVDADMLYDRVTVGLTYAHKRNRNAIIDRSLAPSVGQGVRKENIAMVINRSLEFLASIRVLDNDFAYWEVSTSLGGLDNRVARLGEQASVFGSHDTRGRIVEGYPVFGIWKRPILGFRDADGDGILIDGQSGVASSGIVFGDTSVYAGWMHPRLTANYGTQLSVLNRRLSASVYITYRGNYIQNNLNAEAYGYGKYSQNASLAEQALALWASSNVDDGGLRQVVSDVRLNSASISWNFSRILLQSLKVRSLSLTLQGSNLGLWSNYNGRDPAVNSAQGEMLQDNGGVIPQPRKYALNVRVGL